MILNLNMYFKQRTKSESPNLAFGFSNFHTVQSMILCESVKQTSQIYDLMMVAYSVSTQRTYVSWVSIINKDEVTVHLSSCMATDNYHSDRCPHIDYIKNIISKKGYKNLVEGTYISNNAKRKREEGIYKSY